jgi:hypothetical protein
MSTKIFHNVNNSLPALMTIILITLKILQVFEFTWIEVVGPLLFQITCLVIACIAVWIKSEIRISKLKR